MLRRASEQRDAEALANLCAGDAEVRIVNRETPPSVEFSPRAEYHKTMVIAERNFAAMQEG